MTENVSAALRAPVWRRQGIGASFLGALLLVAACTATAPSSGGAQTPSAVPAQVPSSALQTIVDAARQEGALDLSWRADSFGGADGMAQLASAFNAYYGLNLAIQYTPGLPDVDMAAQAVQQYQAQRPPTTDVYRGTASPMIPLIQAQALVPVDWATWAPNVTNPDSVAPGNVAVSVQTQVPGITYNSSKLTGDQVPRSMQALLAAEPGLPARRP